MGTFKDFLLVYVVFDGPAKPRGFCPKFSIKLVGIYVQILL